MFAGALNPFAPGPRALSKASAASYAKQVRRQAAAPPPAHGTPTRTPKTPARISLDAPMPRGGSPWDNMPSSPLEPTPGAEATVLAYGRRGTLEWACAQERVRRGSVGAADGLDGALLGLGAAKRKRDAEGRSLRGHKKTKSFGAGGAEDALPVRVAVDGNVSGKAGGARALGPARSLGSGPEPGHVGVGAKSPTLSDAVEGRLVKTVLDEGDARAGEDTDEEDVHEAITPLSSLGGDSDAFWTAPGSRVPVSDTAAPSVSVSPAVDGKDVKPVPAVAERDDELMSAALVLCGLGRRG
jgi:hypothetical protein